jgi:broad specificity phosphatase PhoE
MGSIPESLLKSLDKVQQFNQKKLLLIRHTDREEMLPGTLGNDLHITDKGNEKAFELGRTLKSFSIEWCKTSPLLRCTQTLDSIEYGYGRNIALSNCELLGEPGSFVFDGDLAAQVFIDHGAEAVIRNLINGSLFPGIRSSREGSEYLLKGLVNIFEENTGNGICISHDAILMPFISHYCNEHFQEQWLPPLGGVVLTEFDNKYTICWNGNMHEVIL